mgnify:CR=1 FL=1
MTKLEQDMKQGKFYRYKTKPRIMPIVKWCSIILTILVALSLLISAIFGFIDNTVCLFSPASGEEGNVSMTMNAVFYLVLYLYNLQIVLVAPSFAVFANSSASTDT